MKISLIISTYNKPEYLECCLKSIALLQEFPDEIIVADDGSGIETTQVIERYQTLLSVPLIHERQDDEGYLLARSRNNGILKSTGDYLIFIDEDLILHPKFIHDHRRFAKENHFYCGTRVRIGSQKSAEIMNNPRNRLAFWESDLHSRLNTIRIPFLHKIISGPKYTYKRLRGCHLAFWKDDLIKINGFDERYTSWGREDSDIVMRMTHSGVKRVNLKWAALAYHLHHEVKEAISKNTAMMFEVIRSKAIRAQIGIDQH